VNEQEQDSYEAELRRTTPARLPEDFMARLRVAKPDAKPARRTSRQPGYHFSVAQTSKSAVSRVPEPACRHAAAPTWKSVMTAAPIAFGAALRSIYDWSPNKNQPKAGGPVRWHLWRWLAPGMAVALAVAAMLSERTKLSRASSAEQKPADAVHGLKANDVQVDQELVSSYDVVAKLPGGEPVRFRCQAWRDQWSVTDTNRGVEIVQYNPRVEVVPVRFETY